MQDVRLPVSGNADQGATLALEQDALAVSRHYFNLYRLLVATIFLVAFLLFDNWLNFGQESVALFSVVAWAYWLASALLLLWVPRLDWHEDVELTLQVLVDIAAITLMMSASGGTRSGLSFMLMVSLAGAALVGQGRLSLLYAAIASLAILGEQSVRSFWLSGDTGGYLQAALTAIGFFATAIVMRMLAKRVIANQRLAHKRGVDLRNVLRINQRVISDMEHGVIVSNREGLVRLYNPQAEQLLRVKVPAEAGLGNFSAELASQFLAWNGLEETEQRVGLGDGHAVNARFVPAGEGGDTLIFLEDLARQEERLQQIKLAALGRLTAGIAHEIRNPLTAISQAAELLREERRGEIQEKLTRIINDNAQRMERMVRDVLDLGRRDRAEPEKIGLRAYFHVMQQELSLQSDSERVQWEIVGEPDIWFDRGHLNQVLWNLVTNALRYAGPETGAVKVMAFTSGERTEIHVGDNGPGIDATTAARLFEPFFTTHSRGTGLGLYIARELSEANGATLDFVDNSPGAHFRIRGRA